MTEQLFETGLCCVCRRTSNVFCDQCNRWVCPNHLKVIHVAHEDDIHLCSECAKHVKPGVRIGDVIITKKMLPELEG